MAPPMQNVIVPWRDHGNPLRLNAYHRVCRHLTGRGLAPISLPVSPWSPGAARNAGAKIALDEVLVFNDADTICPAGQIRAAIVSAKASGSLVYAYTVYQREDPDGRVMQEMVNPPSMGCAAIRRDAFRQIGGFDERFRGWGYEDIDFAERCMAELGPILRIDGHARHLWHGERRSDDAPEDSDPDQVKGNLALFRARFDALLREGQAHG